MLDSQDGLRPTRGRAGREEASTRSPFETGQLVPRYPRSKRHQQRGSVLQNRIKLKITFSHYQNFDLRLRSVCSSRSHWLEESWPSWNNLPLGTFAAITGQGHVRRRRWLRDRSRSRLHSREGPAMVSQSHAFESLRFKMVLQEQREIAHAIALCISSMDETSIQTRNLIAESCEVLRMVASDSRHLG